MALPTFTDLEESDLLAIRNHELVQMATDFVTRFVQEEHLTPVERLVLESAGVRSADEVANLVQAFPSIADVGVRLPILSNAAAQQTSAAYQQISAASVTSLQTRPPLGADTPPGESRGIGTIAGIAATPALPITALPAAPAGAIDLRLPAWPVRDQNPRGTCVAFGATACLEHHHSTTGRAVDLSEQLLYYDIKTHSRDPRRHLDGTWLEFARDMIATRGICSELLHTYVNITVMPVAGSAPSRAAVADARRRILTAATYMRKPGGAAATVLGLLANGRPVAISLPCFADPAITNGPLNWTTALGWAYGRVIDPPPRSVVVGGHCVCITGFVPDPAEPTGGHFVFRNSWGTAWAHSAPTGGYNSPEVGYGEVTATYVDTYTWELFQV